MRGRDLRSLREQAGMRRNQLAELVGCKPDYLRNIEGSVDQPSAVVAYRLARALSKALEREVGLDDFSDDLDDADAA